MSTYVRMLAVLTALVASTIWGGSEAAQKSAALVLAVNGSTEPAVDAYAEVMIGQKLALGDDTRIEFLHYGTCQTVVVKGGRVMFTEMQFVVNRGKVVDVKRGSCPKMVVLSADTRTAGALLRASDSSARVKLTTRPEFVLVGANRREYRTVRIVRADTAVFEGPLEGAVFKWPAGDAALPPAKDYRIDLVDARGGDVRSFDAELRDRRSGAALTVVRVD